MGMEPWTANTNNDTSTALEQNMDRARKAEENRDRAWILQPARTARVERGSGETGSLTSAVHFLVSRAIAGCQSKGLWQAAATPPPSPSLDPPLHCLPVKEKTCHMSLKRPPVDVSIARPRHASADMPVVASALFTSPRLTYITLIPSAHSL